ncbi:hypothetical protein [Natronosalvus halobius]|uniref:hypothetical protein n=1 Tax=Natronosalvus halobius TaxID=2953746 RepID=UPI0020A20E14|nr:hypothetical protein [Natronosalvus halobius]USZ71584.1 hypothetical protein NGM15_16210 [Natronosalvus halobius]
MGEKPTESCGRCAMSTVVDATEADRSDGERAARDPYARGAIEVEESSVRRVSPAAWLEGISTRLDDAARRFIYGR